MHTYPKAGQYTVTLTVTDSTGSEATRQSTVTVDPITVFAPQVVFHPSETYFPDDPNRFLQNSRLRWDKPDLNNSNCADEIMAAGSGYPARGVAELDASRLGSDALSPYVHKKTWGHPATGCQDDASLFVSSTDYPDALKTKVEDDAGFVLDLRDNNTIRAGNTRFDSTDPLAHPPLYTEYNEGPQGNYIIYWFFYPFNGWSEGTGNTSITGKDVITEKHEGDWEHIVVRLNAEGNAEEVAYYQHYCDPEIVPFPQQRRRAPTLLTWLPHTPSYIPHSEDMPHTRLRATLSRLLALKRGPLSIT